MSGHTKEQIEHMVSRFLSWTLPADFSPDGGISYSPQMHPPSGTNLLCYPQARAMVLHMVTGLPEGDPEREGELSAEETAKIDAAWETHKAAGRPAEPEIGGDDVRYRGWECGYNTDAAFWCGEGWEAYLGGPDIDAPKVTARTWGALLDEIDAHDLTEQDALRAGEAS